MKEYRIEAVQLGCQMEPAEVSKTSSLIRNVKDFFYPTDEMIPGHLLTEHAEMLMQTMNREGWEVVSTSAVGTYPENVVLLITFAREMQIRQTAGYGDMP